MMTKKYDLLQLTVKNSGNITQLNLNITVLLLPHKIEVHGTHPYMNQGIPTLTCCQHTSSIARASKLVHDMAGRVLRGYSRWCGLFNIVKLSLGRTRMKTSYHHHHHHNNNNEAPISSNWHVFRPNTTGFIASPQLVSLPPQENIKRKTTTNVNAECKKRLVLLIGSLLATIQTRFLENPSRWGDLNQASYNIQGY